MSNEKKRSISEGDYYKLVGLLTIAEEHNRALDVIQQAVASVVGEEPNAHGFYDYASDAISGEYSPRTLLSKMGIEVEF